MIRNENKKQKESEMKIAIVGIGGVGGYYGGMLARKYESSSEHDIFFVARGEHLQKIKTDGLKVVAKEGDFIARPSLATDNPAELGPLDLIIFGVKGYDLENAARMITGNLHADSVIIPLLNGVDNVERLKTVVDTGIIMNGCVYISTRIVNPGVVEHVGGPCALFFGPVEGPIDRYFEVETIMKEAGIKATLSDHITTDVWSKYIFVGPLGGITSMLNQPLGVIMENEKHRTMLEGLMKEVEAVAQARDISLPENIVQQSLNVASSFPYETKTSIQLDFEKGRQTEMETFTGYVVRSGKKLGIKTPLHDAVYAALKNK
jgi:2-dehydropantoate 2-reductase